MALRGLPGLLMTTNQVATSVLAGSRKVGTRIPLRLDHRAHHLGAASNMNYALELSLILEKHLARLQADEGAVQSAGLPSRAVKAASLMELTWKQA
jgi:hypothetical protein